MWTGTKLKTISHVVYLANENTNLSLTNIPYWIIHDYRKCCPAGHFPYWWLWLDYTDWSTTWPRGMYRVHTYIYICQAQFSAVVSAPFVKWQLKSTLHRLDHVQHSSWISREGQLHGSSWHRRVLQIPSPTWRPWLYSHCCYILWSIPLHWHGSGSGWTSPQWIRGDPGKTGWHSATGGVRVALPAVPTPDWLSDLHLERWLPGEL